MAMNYLRELLYRPKRSDKSLMARFYFADLALNAVAQELDSFDGRKDPERCTCLVNRLRSCQDKLLGICNRMLEHIEPGGLQRSREFRAKFPDDIMTDNLAGQLWFGAECLAAGSSIMHKERESESMRPLAKAVTKSLEKVRALLREQCLSPQPEYTESIRENIKIFDRLFAEFEFAYVQCMVHVKTVREYELQQDLTVLFSDTLRRALKNEMVTQDMVDLYEPSLMFAIPRLAIVYGLLHCPDGPLNVDRGSKDFPDLFLPFKNLLKKIRELLLTLAPHEAVVLEMLLCQHEEPANISVKLKEVERMLEAREKTEEGRAMADRLQMKLDEQEHEVDEEREQRRRQRRLHREGKEVVHYLMRDLVSNVVELAEERIRHKSEPPPPVRTTRRRRGDIVEIDCTDPEIRVSGTARSHQRFSSTPVSSSSRQQQQQQQPQSHHQHHHRRVEVSVVGAEDRSRPTDLATSTSHSASRGDCATGVPLESSTYSPRPRQRLKRHNAKRDSRRIPLRYQKDRRAKFKSTEDLLHRLYVCISGAADQLQSNYAGDFRSILKTVFMMNVSVDEEDAADEEEDEVAKRDEPMSPGSESEINPDMTSPAPRGSPAAPSPSGIRRGAAAAAAASIPTSQSLPSTMSAFPRVDLGTDALQEEMSHQLVNDFLPLSVDDYEQAGNTDPEGRSQGLTYAQNLDLHLQQEQDAEDGVVAASARASRSNSRSEGGDSMDRSSMDEGTVQDDPSGRGGLSSPTPSRAAEFYQPEPTLLDIASGSRSGSVVVIDDGDLPRETRPSESVFHDARVRVSAPPRWVPDAEAPNCVACQDPFTLFRRRHHCRNCGNVFCGRCSSHTIPLPHYNMHRPVRVCDRCHALCQFPPLSPGARDPGSPGVLGVTSDDEDEEDEEEDEEGAVSPGGMLGTSPWGSRNLGMIS